MSQLNSSISYDDFNLAFQITMFSMWGIGVDLVRLIIRYGKSYPAVMNIHAISMMIITFITYMYVIGWTVLYISSSSQGGMYNLVFGYILVVGTGIQFSLGIFGRAQMNKPFISQKLFIVKKIHKITGWLLSIVGKLFVTFNLLATSMFRVWLFVLGFMVIFFIAIEVIYRNLPKKKIWKFPLKHQSKFQTELQEILNHLNGEEDNFEDYKQKGLRYIILDNCMYYIDEDFMHPGGQSALNIYNGAHQIAPEYPRHKHTKYAMNYLNNRFVGEIKVASLMATQKLPIDQIQWSIQQVIPLDGGANHISFKTLSGNFDDTLRVDQFGKYVMIQCISQQFIRKQYRPYTILKSQTSYQKNKVKRLLDYYKFYILNEQVQLNQNKETKTDNSVITFLIKKYLQGQFTKSLFNNKAGKNFTITGPYGRGLKLKNKSKGFMIMIGAGTGVLPYIDLFTYLFQKTLVQIIRDKVGDTIAQKANDQSIDYSPLYNIKILFIGSFQSMQHFYLGEVIKNLYILNKTHGLDQFDMMIRYNNNEEQPKVKMIKQTFGLGFIKGLIEKQPDRIYYCGPSALEQQIRKAQYNIKTDKSIRWQGQFIYI